MKILDLFPNPQPLTDNTLWVNRVRFDATSPSNPTTARTLCVGQPRDTDRWACSCSEWIRKRDCKHIRFIEGRT